MKYARLFVFFIISLLLVTLLLSWLMPVKLGLDKSISIQAPAASVYEHLVNLKQFNEWSVWNQHDSTVIHTITGTDGTPGARSDWRGDPNISGEGSIELTAAEKDKSVSHTIRFYSPKENKAASVFTLSELNGLTTVNWHFELETPRPWNIFNLFADLDKQLGADFETGLAALKTKVEKNNLPADKATVYEVKEMDFPATTYALIRQVVQFRDIPDFFSKHLPLVFEEAQKQKITAGFATGLYFIWDNANQRTDMAAAMPLPAGKELGSPIIRMEKLPAGKAIYTDFYGPYEKTAVAWDALRQYMSAKQLKEKAPVIEQYITDPAIMKDTTKWQTRVIMLIED